MRQILIATGLAAGLAMTPAMAADEATKTDDANANRAEEMHAPTNRVGEMVPTMSTSDEMSDKAAKGADEANTPETLHAPTNRVGDQVPTMKAPETE
jgi:hypothetical protein